jgi:hypothetical protein
MRSPKMNDRPIQKIIRHQQVRTPAEDVHPHGVFLAAFYDDGEFILIPRLDVISHRPAQPKPGMLRHRLITFYDFFKVCE